jgi:hypothetical protein
VIEGRPSTRWIASLVALAGVLGVALVAFALLFLSVPEGWTSPFGFAPDIGPAFRDRWWVPRLDLDPRALRGAASTLTIVAWGAWLAALVVSRRCLDAPNLIRVVLGGAIGLHLALLLTPPALSKDLFHHALFGRMLVTRGLNPYLTPGDALAGEPLWTLANWRALPSHYGPVFTLLSALAAAVGRGDPLATALAFKALAAACGIVTVLAIAALARQDGRDGALPALIHGWNPLVVLETAGSGHNEAVMLAPALVGLWLVRRGRALAGFTLLIASVHVKGVTAALALYALIELVRAGDDGRARARRLFGLAAVTLALTALVYAPFWSGGRALDGARSLLLEGPRTLGAGARDASTVGVMTFLAILVLGAIVVWRAGRPRVLDMSALAILTFVTVVFPAFFPWYLLPPLALLVAAPPSAPRRVALGALLALAAGAMLRYGLVEPGLSL